MSYTYRLTWDRVTEESCSEGDTDGNGFVINGDLVQLDHENLPSREETTSRVFDTFETLLASVEEYGPWREWSCSPPCGPAHCWLCSDEHGSLDQGDSEVFTYALHVRQADGTHLTEEQFRKLRRGVGR